MVGTKTQRNKSDKETIIDMEPVKDKQKISFFKINNFIVPIISILFLIAISTWLIFYYLPNFFQKQTNRIIELSNIVQKMDKKEKIKLFFEYIFSLRFIKSYVWNKKYFKAILETANYAERFLFLFSEGDELIDY